MHFTESLDLNSHVNHRPLSSCYYTILVTVKVNFRLAASHAAEDIPIGASVIVYPYYRITDITLQQ